VKAKWHLDSKSNASAESSAARRRVNGSSVRSPLGPKSAKSVAFEMRGINNLLSSHCDDCALFPGRIEFHMAKDNVVRTLDAASNVRLANPRSVVGKVVHLEGIGANEMANGITKVSISTSGHGEVADPVHQGWEVGTAKPTWKVVVGTVQH
jgi:hypothetical protein